MFVCLDKRVSNCLIKIKVMDEKMMLLLETLIVYIPKISGSLEDIVIELKELNEDRTTQIYIMTRMIWVRLIIHILVLIWLIIILLL